MTLRVPFVEGRYVQMETMALHTIRPEGWLREQIHRNAEGFFGHLTDISEFLKADNGWLQWRKTSEEFAAQTGKPASEYQSFGWEEQAYWLRGAYRLALLDGNQALMAQCEPYFEAILASRREDGYFGPECLRNIETKGEPVPDLWPHMVMADVLRDRYLATGDERITALLEAFFHYCLALPDDKFLPPYSVYKNWYGMIQVQRSCDMVPVIRWLYEKTGDEALVRLAQRFFHAWQYGEGAESDNHVVTFAERVRYQAQRYPFSGDPADIAGSCRRYLDHMAEWGQMPGGLYAADERTREGKRDPRQATETCAMSEIVRSFGYIASLNEDPAWFDRAEDVMFNSFPASHTPDYSGLHYLTADNQPELDAENHDYTNKGCMTRYSAFRYRCCQHNAASGWPNFVSTLFFGTGDGIAACSYAPCTFEGTAAGRRIRIHEETEYPFRDTILFTVASDGPFVLRLRVPGWAKNASVRRNGLPVDASPKDGWIRLSDVSDGDTVELQLSMEASFRCFPDNNGFVCLDRGPLTYSLRLKETWIPAGQNTDRAGRVWTEYDVKAEAPYTFALDVSRAPVAEEAPQVALQPFTPENAPVRITAWGKPLPSWGIGDDNTIEPVPASPVDAEGEEQALTFVPLGCMRVRMSCFPRLKV